MISSPGQRPPYAGTAGYPHAPNAALLIDFDNVTMGIRSDLGKELKSLLNSEVIRGKVAVQRAYADWRRYPQYIVPLAESSIDLIFAPAYGSSKKNATDLRMAIDAIELVFTRPEIGTFILMTGDSDFSSCVLKLKEYGKYVIGVGMRESSSDLLIQNCDEYYSYHSLSGLTRAGEVQESAEDPWVLMKRAAQQMEANNDVMRTDRLKQVMLDLDPSFDEKKIGYSKFSRFVQEAANKGVVKLRKGENGQYELVRGEEAEAEPEPEAAPAGESRRGRGRERDREGRRDGRREARPPRKEAEERPAAEAPHPEPAPKEEIAEPSVEPAVAAESRQEVVAAVDGAAIDHAYSLLQAAVRDLTGGASRSVRDGDVKRRMLDMSPGFDEADLGFSKFTRFLRQAHDAEVIDLQRSNGGNYEVALPASGKRLPPPTKVAATPAKGGAEVAAAPEPRIASREAAAPAAATPEKTAEKATTEETPASGPPAAAARPTVGVGALRGRRAGRPGAAGGPPPILPGQAVAPTPAAPAAKETAATAEKPAEKPAERVEARVESPVAAAPEAAGEEPRKKSRRGRRGRGKGREEEAADQTKQADKAEKVAEHEPTEPVPAAGPAAAEAPKRTPPPEGPIDKITARARRGRAIRGDVDESVGAPPILPGQAVTPPAAEVTPKPEAEREAAAPAEPAAEVTPKPEAEREAAAPAEPAAEAAPRKGRGRGRGRGAAKKAEAVAEPTRAETALAGLPTDRDGVIAQLSSYKGVGQKTAESLYDRFGERTFEALQHEPAQVRELLGERRAGTLLDQWSADFARRVGAEAATPAAETGAPEAKEESPPEPEKKPARKSAARGGRGSRGGGRRKKETAPSS